MLLLLMMMMMMMMMNSLTHCPLHLFSALGSMTSGHGSRTKPRMAPPSSASSTSAQVVTLQLLVMVFPETLTTLLQIPSPTLKHLLSLAPLRLDDSACRRATTTTSCARVLRGTEDCIPPIKSLSVMTNALPGPIPMGTAEASSVQRRGTTIPGGILHRG